MKIYVASSWRNDFQPRVVEDLRGYGYEVYDFKNPAEGEHGFSWEEIEPDHENWTTEQYIRILDHPISERGFSFDWNAMLAADACVLVLPCGRSAHIEAGYFVGAGKPLFIYVPTATTEPELMYKMATGVYHNFGNLLTGMDHTNLCNCGTTSDDHGQLCNTMRHRHFRLCLAFRIGNANARKITPGEAKTAVKGTAKLKTESNGEIDQKS